MRTRVVIGGITGRMGRLIAARVAAASDLELVGGTVRAGHALAGKPTAALGGPLADTAGVLCTADDLKAVLDGAPGVFVDFALSEASLGHIAAARAAGWAMLVGTTGLSADAEAALEGAAADVAVLRASNTSLGANLMFALSGLVARALPNADAEVVELHHSAKKDAPSGTALSIAEAIVGASARGPVVDHRTGHAPRQPGEVGVFGVRGGDVVGEHTAYFFAAGERIELTHRVTDRGVFADGAVTAARYLAHQDAGAYTMAHVLGLTGLSADEGCP